MGSVPSGPRVPPRVAFRGHYNAGFILLRATLELILKGAFFECLAHRNYRNRAEVLRNNDKGRRLLMFLDEVVRSNPSVEQELEELSAGIFDKLAPVIEDRET